jgi:hypothetical protein
MIRRRRRSALVGWKVSRRFNIPGSAVSVDTAEIVHENAFFRQLYRGVSYRHAAGVSGDGVSVETVDIARLIRFF